jgi:MFS family permease
MEATSAVKSEIQNISVEGRRTIFVAHLAFLVDMFDIYLPIVALGPAMEYFVPKNLPSSLTTTLFYVTFAAALLGRPVGSLIFGHFGDKIGRKQTALVSILGFAVVTFFMAVLPGYEAIGLWGIGLLVLLRFVDGVFLGGEYTAANPLAMEYAPKEKRGLVGAFVIGGFPLAYVAVSLVTLALLKIAPAGDLHSPYVQWGWRVPFLVGVALAVLIYLYFAKAVPESRLWLETKKSEAPLKELFQGESLRNFLQVFVMMTGVWFTFNAVAGTLPGILIKTLGVDAKVVTNSLLIVNLILFFGYLAAGQIGQWIGRRTVLIAVGILSVSLLPYLFYVLISGGFESTDRLLLLALIIELLLLPGTWGIGLAYITERFRTGVRASGFGLGWSLSVVIPSFYSFFMLGLERFIPYKYTPIPLLVLGGVLLVIGAAWGPETKDVDF